MENLENPLVTIAIPTYNRADTFLKHTLDSVVRQSYQNLEIIVSDNCSIDNTENLVNGFNDPRIKYIKHSHNIGHSNNFKFCLEQARGECFLLLQDDDLIDHDFVEICLKAVNYSCLDIGVIRTGTRFIDSDGNWLWEMPNRVGELSTAKYFLEYLSFKTGIYLCSTLFNTKRLREVGGFHSKHSLLLDVMAVAKLSSQFGRKDIQESKASNRKHLIELTYSVKIQEWCEESFLLVDVMCNLVAEKNMKLKVRREGRNFIFRHNYNLAKKERKLCSRVKSFRVIFENCGYLYSFWRFYVIAVFFPVKRMMKRKIKQLITHSSG